MAVVNNTKYAPELNYSTRESSYPVYFYRILSPERGSDRNITLTSNGEKKWISWEIPTEQFNPGLCYLEYDLQIPAQGDGMYSWIFSDVYGEIDTFEYRDTGTNYLVNLRHLNMYNYVMNKLETSYEDLLDHDKMLGLHLPSMGANENDFVKFDNTRITHWFEPIQFIRSAANAAITIRRKIFLKEICGKHSFVGLSKDVLFPVNTYIRIEFIGNRIGFRKNSNADPTNAEPLNGEIQITNITLKLAYQQNQDAINEMKQELAKPEGKSIPIPWTSIHSYWSPAGSSSMQYQLPLDRATHGQILQRIIYVPFRYVAPPANQVNLAYDHRIYNTYNAATDTYTYRITSYHTDLNNSQLQRDHVMITNDDDYMLHKRVLQNTLYFNRSSYKFWWVHIDTFDYPESNRDKDGAIYTDGELLDKPKVWTFNKHDGDTDGVFNFMIVQGQKLLRINNSSFVVV